MWKYLIIVCRSRFDVDWDYQEVADMARQWYPELKDRIIFGQPGRYNYKDPGVYKIDHSKSEKVLGIKCKPACRYAFRFP